MKGFALFDSKYTDYKATNTQAKRDLIREYVERFPWTRLKVGFYYSLLDWHHPDYTMDDIHPLTPKRQKQRALCPP
jgi:alpha-L-fucosidase